MSKKSEEYFVGCLLGGAIGDALGAPIEFLRLSQIRDKYGPQGVSDYVEFGNNKGEFTDDTQMTLFTAEGVLRACLWETYKGLGGGALNPIAYGSYQRWLHTQNSNFIPEQYNTTSTEIYSGWLIKQEALYKRRSPGLTCISALEEGIPGTTKEPINDSKGCGTIMRMAPVGLMLPDDLKMAFKVGCDLSAFTHGNPTGYLSGGFFASLISNLAVGVSLMDAISNVIPILTGWKHHEKTLLAVNLAIELFKSSMSHDQKISPDTIEKLGQGWIAEEALAMSLYASLVYENDFKRGVLFAVNHGGDSDSTGSITGNILGLINGLDSIPEKWITNLKANEIVRQIGEDLHVQVKGNEFDIDEEWLQKYPGY